VQDAPQTSGQAPQSAGQLSHSLASHFPSPQLEAQAPHSWPQSAQLSCSSHTPLPQEQAPQSAAQVWQLSERSQVPLPQVWAEHSPQSFAQLLQDSLGSQLALPHWAWGGRGGPPPGLELQPSATQPASAAVTNQRTELASSPRRSGRPGARAFEVSRRGVTERFIPGVFARPRPGKRQPKTAVCGAAFRVGAAGAGIFRFGRVRSGFGVRTCR